MVAEIDSSARLIHPVSLFLNPRHDTVPLAARRDQHAAYEVATALLARGYARGEPILDYPPNTPPPEPVRKADLYQVAMPFARPGDLLLQTTRPPRHDRIDLGRKRLRQSYTDLEDRMFDVWEEYMAWNSRGRVLLHERLHHLLAPEHENKRLITFRESQGAPYLELNDCAGGRQKTVEAEEHRTAVFLLRKEVAWADGPGLIGAFGMDATATAVWCYRLGRDLSHLLETPGFVLAEMTNPGIPERPTNMLCAHNWRIEILLHCVEG